MTDSAKPIRLCMYVRLHFFVGGERSRCCRQPHPINRECTVVRWSPMYIPQICQVHNNAGVRYVHLCSLGLRRATETPQKKFMSGSLARDLIWVCMHSLCISNVHHALSQPLGEGRQRNIKRLVVLLSLTSAATQVGITRCTSVAPWRLYNILMELLPSCFFKVAASLPVLVAAHF